jgi:small subunit ribosomal protein S18
MYCYFCKKNIQEVDFHDTEVLGKYLSKSGKIKPRTKTGCCAKHQREVTTAIKRARVMGILPFVAR